MDKFIWNGIKVQICGTYKYKRTLWERIFSFNPWVKVLYIPMLKDGEIMQTLKEGHIEFLIMNQKTLDLTKKSIEN